MQSMTGYGRSQQEQDGQLITLEISSVNRRNLEVTASLPREWQTMERMISEQIRARFARGKFHVQIQVRAGESQQGAWNVPQILSQYEELCRIAGNAGQQMATDGNFWLRLAQIAQENEGTSDWEVIWKGLSASLNEALDALAKMRASEGAATAEDFNQRLDQFDRWRLEIAELSTRTVPNYRDLLLERLKKAQLEIDLDDERVLKEISLFADRCDIEEELTRLTSHLAQFRETMASGVPIGRKMDFLCQEINREINTIGSKANNLEITRLVIECKNELERIREQVQNIE